MNNVISLGQHKRIKFESIKKLNLNKDSKVLDLCTGTGDVAKFIRDYFQTAHVIGVDFSENMLKIACKKAKDINFIQADCTDLPFEKETFDACTISFGLRNIEDRGKAIEEIHRVLKKGGVLMHIDFGKSNKILDFAFELLVPLVAKLFYRDALPYNYLIESKRTFSAPDELIEIFCDNGFVFKKRYDFLFGVISSQVLEKQ